MPVRALESSTESLLGNSEPERPRALGRRRRRRGLQGAGVGEIRDGEKKREGKSGERRETARKMSRPCLARVRCLYKIMFQKYRPFPALLGELQPLPGSSGAL